MGLTILVGQIKLVNLLSEKKKNDGADSTYLGSNSENIRHILPRRKSVLHINGHCGSGEISTITRSCKVAVLVDRSFVWWRV